jgi:hypothetical protein
VQIPSMGTPKEANPAHHELNELAEGIVPLLERANGTSWYEEEGNDVDQAVAALCRVRRAGSGARGSSGAGDAAVRDLLGLATPGTAIWIASRAISYMDENGFPETVPEPAEADG